MLAELRNSPRAAHSSFGVRLAGQTCFASARRGRAQVKGEGEKYVWCIWRGYCALVPECWRHQSDCSNRNQLLKSCEYHALCSHLGGLAGHAYFTRMRRGART